jgi:hypothetical protein
MEKKGTLRKMNVSLNSVVEYTLNLDNEPVEGLNKLLNSEVNLSWTGNIFCINCGRSIKKTYGQGFCFKCFSEAPQAAPCIIRPELCEAHLGKGRDPEWEERNHNKPHVVYLAQTSDVKVGVTRKTQVPNRWIDQGAWRALPIAEVPYRQLAGELELELKQFITDRTDWRKMLTDEKGDEDIYELRDTYLAFLPSKFEQYKLKDESFLEIEYPVTQYPSKVSSLSLEKEKSVQGELSGIRGQYLYFNRNHVINLRKYSGYEVIFQY